jgi:ketosteroid isomerase-like protein
MKRNILLLFILGLILGSCTHRNINLEVQKQMILQTDKDFSQMSIEKGMKTAFQYYAADEVILMREGNDPLFGKNELIQQFGKIPDGKVLLSWVPVKADVSGELGYTFGKWESRVAGSDSVEYGTYVTVWKKQEDGTWKYVLDAGNNGKKSK